MRVYKFWFEGDLDWWSRPAFDPILQDALATRFASIFLRFAQENEIDDWRSYDGRVVSLNEAHALFRKCIDGHEAKLRDGTCRFAQLGQDPILYVCIQHEDALDVGSYKQQFPGLCVEDVSEWLASTDVFDW